VELGDRLKLRDDNVLAFCWVIDFPWSTGTNREKRWDPSHHLFTAPVWKTSAARQRPGLAAGSSMTWS
jgi:aspartyl-tRNA synthetase